MFPKVRVFLFAAAASLALSLQTGCSATRRVVPARKLVAVAEVCATNGFVTARRTNFNALADAGYAAVVVPDVADTNLIESVMDKVDALVLTGAISQSDYAKRNGFDYLLMRMAIERGLPIVGFCRGHQVINRYFGGKGGSVPDNLEPKVVHRGKESPYVKDCFHEMNIVPGTRLAKTVGKLRVKVNTSHRFHVEKLGEGLVVTARADDGIIEALEHESLPITGFQFHPERLNKLDGVYVRMIRDAIEHPSRKAK